MNILKKTEKIENGIISAKEKDFKGERKTHRHDFFEIEYICDGSGEYFINGVAYPIEKNRIYIMTPADFHYVKSDGAKLINVMFSAEYVDMDSLFRLIKVNNSHSKKLDTSDSALICGMLLEVVSAFKEGKATYALQFLSCIISKLADVLEINDGQVPSYVSSTILYLFENFQKGISLSDAAGYTGLSPAYLSSIFHQSTGVTFKEYLDDIRFEYSARLLSFTDLTVQEVCFKSGFTDYANFMRRFKKRFKVTPKTYQTQIFKK